MESKAVIIGCGNVGSTFAYSLYKENLCDILLINHNKCRAYSNVLDILDCEIDVGAHTISWGDYNDISPNDIVIICAGNSSLLRSCDRSSEYDNSIRIANEIINNLNLIGFNGILVNVMNPCDEITNQFRKLNVPKNRIIGTGTLLETIRLRRLVYEQYGYTTNAFVVGRHGNYNAVVCNTSIPETVLIDVHKRVWKIYEGKGFTNFGISNILLMVVKAILHGGVELCVSTLCGDTYGFSNSAISVPCILGRTGIVSVPFNSKVSEALNKLFKEDSICTM